MNRRFLRPLFSFWDPFFSDPIVIRKVLPLPARNNRAHQYQHKNQVEDPNETFDNFFKEYFENTSALKAQEKQFFEKHYPEKVGKKFNPYQVLGIDNNSDIQKVKQAYRVNALKYHPKNNTTAEGEKKFKEISRAYNQIIRERHTNEYGEDVSTKSLFEDFHKQMQNFSKVEEKENVKQKIEEQKGQTKEKQEGKSNIKVQQKKTENKGTQVNSKTNGKQGNKNVEKQKKSARDFLKGAELYSQSSFFEFVNGKRKLHVTKMYEKDGKKIKVDRVEENRNDGTVEVTETFDDGKQIRNKKFIQGANRKQQYLGN